MRLLPDIPEGRPSFRLSADEVDTVIDLLCKAASEARMVVTDGMLEVPMTVHMRKRMRRLKSALGLTNLEIIGEFELLDLSNVDPEVLGRIDVVLRFLHQFGDEEAYLGVECKRVGSGDSALNHRYVAEGVNRFATGKYGAGHHWGVMLGYVIKLPAATLVADIDNRIRKAYGEDSRLESLSPHGNSLDMKTGRLPQGSGGHIIRLIHIFVDMTPASQATTESRAATGSSMGRED